jgi:hypothetical protein
LGPLQASNADPVHDPAVYVSLALGGWVSGLFADVGSAGFYACLRIAACAKVVASTTGITVYRIWGGNAFGLGRSWTPIDPRTFSSIEEYAAAAGLPAYPLNSAQYLSIGTISSLRDMTITAATEIGTNPGGLIEYLYSPGASQLNVILQDVIYLGGHQ